MNDRRYKNTKALKKTKKKKTKQSIFVWGNEEGGVLISLKGAKLKQFQLLS